MAETRWEDIVGKELRYADHTWELTGDVSLLDSGDVLAVEARQTDDVQRDPATLFFDNADPPDSLNPGSHGDHFHHLEWVRDTPVLIVKTDGPTYRYELQRVEYE
ncbi:hypothetical protein [Haloarchaeobius sp. HRN-SO-5]|uniref:hypothetical protein n=1 Tax=Haloarchaeobius sp. HRN-SO-5 TaxID=3446118 RepID=UPI003EB98C5E